MFSLIKSCRRHLKTSWLVKVLSSGTFNGGWLHYHQSQGFGFILGCRGFLIRLSGFQGPILGVSGSYIEIQWSVWYGLRFDIALNGLYVAIPYFNLSNFTSKDTVPPKVQHILASVLFYKIVKDMNVKFDMTIRQKAIFDCLQDAHAHNFLLVISLDGLGQHMSRVKYRTILRYHLMILISY